jgi:hypothetical protein
MTTNQSRPRHYELVRRIIYVAIALAVILSCFIDYRQEFTPSPESQKVYYKVEGLSPGDHLLISIDYDPSSEAELYPMSLALLRHCFKKGVIPIVMTPWPTSVGIAKKGCDDAVADANSMFGKKVVSGKDYVFLGFRPGVQNLILKMGDNLKGAFDKDYYGQSTQSMEALAGVNSLKNINLLVDLAAMGTVELWIAYGADRAGIPMATGTTAVMTPDLYPFYQSNQLIGFLGGLRGAADYEKLLKIPGRGERGMLAQSATHVLIILLILGANIRMFAGRLLRKKEGLS